MSGHNYLEAAIQGEVARILQSSTGGRSRAMFAAAAALGALVGASLLNHEEIEALLVEAGLATGKPEREVRSHVQRGLRRGMENPRSVLCTDPGLVPMQAHHAGRARCAPIQARALTCPRPPEGAINTLWEAALPVTQDKAVTTYLAEVRGLDPEIVALWDLARVLPVGVHLPALARCGGRTWTESSHRLIFRTYDDAGKFVSLRARFVGQAANARKTLAPTGYTTKGLVMACPLAVQLLAGGPPDWWTAHDVVIAEGDVDFLTWATQQPECAETGPAVFGITSGAWTQGIADRVPTGARVVIRTHDDAAGDKYAEKLHATLAGRCTVLRPTPEAAS